MNKETLTQIHLEQKKRRDFLNQLKSTLLEKFGYGDTIPEDMEWDWNWAWDHMYFEDVCALGEFRNIPNVINFVYDRMTGLVFINLEAGDHAPLMGFLEQLHCRMTTRELRHHGDGHYDLGDRYIQNDRGFFLSSVSDGIYKSDTFVMTAQEKLVFRNYHIRVL